MQTIFGDKNLDLYFLDFLTLKQLYFYTCLSKSNYGIFSKSKYYIEFKKFNSEGHTLYLNKICQLGMFNTLKTYIRDHSIYNMLDCVFTTIKAGQLEILKYLLHLNNYDDREYNCFAYQAAIYGKLEIVKYFVSLKATDYYDIKLIRFSVKHCHLDIVKYLLCVNDKFKDDNTLQAIFKLAAKQGDLETVKYLYSLTKIKSYYYNHAMLKVIAKNRFEIFQYLFSVKLDHNQECLRIIIHLIIDKERIDFLKYLISNNITLNNITFPCSILMGLIETNNMSFLEYIISLRPDILDNCLEISNNLGMKNMANFLLSLKK